ncbi:MAG TPA: hypothetical protein PK313_14170, partial [Myxococcota bacterium]|nr:hypothetical protein [Myxococcota bacterium]
MKKFAVLASVIALSAVSCFEPDENDPPPWLGSYNAALCQYELSDVLLVVETSARMGMPSGYKQGNKDISRDELVVDALKRTLPHVKKMVDFGLLTFPFVDHRDGNPAAPDACTVGERIIDPGSPYGWIVSRLEHIESGGKASV